MQTDIADPTKFLLGDFRLSMWIPSDIAGKVIGKKGVVISNMQRETGCKVITACQPVNDSLWVCVTMIGEPSATIKAYSAIEKIALEVDEVVAEFSLHKTKHAFLIGKGGLAVIKKISADTNVRIFVPGPDNSSSGFLPNGMQKSNASLEGTFENVIRAFEMLEHQFKNPPAVAKIDKTKDASVSPEKSSKVEKISKEIQQNENKNENNVKKEKTLAVPAVKVEKRIEIPANIVGILLVRRETDKQLSVMNQIQKSTGTTVSRVAAPGSAKVVRKEVATDDELVAAAAAAVASECKELDSPSTGVAAEDTAAASKGEDDDEAVGSARRRKDVSDDEDDDDDDDDDDNDDNDDEDDDPETETVTEADTGVSEAAESLAGMAVAPSPSPSPSPVDATASADSSAPSAAATAPPVPFIILGYYQANVDKAEECISRIVAGDRIKDVLSGVSTFLRGQPRQAINSRAKLMFGTRPKEAKAKAPKGKKRVEKQQGEQGVAPEDGAGTPVGKPKRRKPAPAAGDKAVKQEEPRIEA